MARLRAGESNRRCGCQNRSEYSSCRCHQPSGAPRKHRRISAPTDPAVGYRDVPPFTQSFDEAQSPDSTYSFVSNDRLSLTTTDLERARLFTPTPLTPTSSEESSPEYLNINYSHQPEQYVSYQEQSFFQPFSTFGGSQYCHSPVQPASHLVLGIAHTPFHEEAGPFGRPGPGLEFISPHGPSPTSQQRFPRTQEPWTAHPMRHEDPMVMDMDQNMDPVPPAVSPVSPTGAIGGRRVGPLTQGQRRKANAVRMKGACLRCSYMKETCDARENGCANCELKRGRKWKLGCVRRKLSEQIEYLFPSILRQRYSAESVNRYTTDTAWFYLDRRDFILELDLGLPGPPLQLPVKEVNILDTRYQELHAWKTRNENGVPVMQKTGVWAPPLVLYLTDKPESKRRIQGQLAQCMHGVFAIKEGDASIKKGQVHWPWPCFDHDDNDWEAYIVETIFKYWQKDLPSHKILGKAHTLLFFNFVLDHMCMVKGDALRRMLSNLENTTGFQPGIDVSPDTVNSFLKSLVFQWVLEMTADILKELQDILHTMALGKETSTARSDMAFCLSFMLLVVLGQTQSRLLLLTQYERRETGIDLPLDEAERLIFEMEKEVGTYIIHFHEFALKRRKPMAASPNSNDAAERHAANFGLMQRVKRLTLDTFSAYHHIPMQRFGAEFAIEDHRPRRFKPPPRDIDTFDSMNTHRLCWKFVEALGIGSPG